MPQQSKTQRRNKRTWFQKFRLSLPARQETHAHSRLTTVEVQNVTQDPEPGVDRHTSIRSVATLPAYSAVPHEGEGVIGREGDREGMDTVLEFPETVDEEEGRREQEMASLWRIRQQRRQEAAEREERRRRRREARARGDSATLTAIRHESMMRTTYQQENGSTAMISEHHSRPRERRVSTVNYGDLGVARHDGSRVRANSNEDSDSRPLLDAVGTTGMAGPVRPWMSHESQTSYSTHHRVPSTTSIMSMSSHGSDERPSNSHDRSDSEVISLQQTRSGTRSRSHSLAPSHPLSSTDADLGENRIPLPEPPQYDTMGFEEAPPYEPTLTTSSPAPPAVASESSPPQLPAIDRLPSIRITESSSPEPPPLARRGSHAVAPALTIHEETS